MVSYTMPNQARGVDSAPAVDQTVNKIYKPYPHSHGETFTNELYIPLYAPFMWKMFNFSPEIRQKLNLADENPMKAAEGDQEVYTFHFRVPTHKIEKYTRKDGTVGFASVICPTHFNQYMVNNMGKRPLFKDAECPFCIAEKNAWEEHNARWAEIERATGVKKKSLTSDGYRNQVASDPILKDTYARAKSLTMDEKFIVNVFDYSKLMGKIPKTEDEKPEYQIWFAPKTVYGFLHQLFEEDLKSGIMPFFVHDDPNGLQLIKLIKDTTRCSSNNWRDTKYTVMKGGYYKADENWRSFLTNLSIMADPSDLLMILSKSEMQAYANGGTETYNTPEHAPVQNYAQFAPKAPVAAPVVAPPVAPVAPPSAPMVPPPAPVMAPVAAPPVVAPVMAPPAPMTPPVAPVMAPPAPMVPPVAPSVPDRGNVPPGQVNSW